MKQFDFHTDAGHGWLKVHLYDARDIGLDPEDFTAYSYRHGDHLYLEEDCDAGRFAHAWEAAGRKLDINPIDDGYHSPIRSYERIVPAPRFEDEIRF